MRSVFLPVLCAGGLLVAAAYAQPALSLEAAMDRGFYAEGTPAEVYVEARVRASLPPGQPAPAGVRNLAFVLDRSGSMAGERLQALRRAVAAAFDLTSGRDTVSVVAFGSEVETVIEAQRRDRLAEVATPLARIEPGGGAALFDALNQGAAQLRRFATPDSVNHLILVTDSAPTKGPREFADFSKLSEAFAREGITLSTIGLGEEFDEDLLAAIARAGNGRFRYLADAGGLADAIRSEVAPLQAAVAHDVVLTVEFRPIFSEVETHGSEPVTVDGTTATYRFPHVFAEQELAVLVSGQARPMGATGVRREAVTVRLQWRGAADGAPGEAVQNLTLRYLADAQAVRTSLNPGVYRTAVSRLISEGMQESIGHLDKGDFRGALRALRRARGQARGLNFELDDEQIAATIRQLDTYLADVEARGMNQLDRKILRSGLFNQFESPTAEDEGAR